MMATIENDVLIQRKQGADTHIDYPVTRYANVLDAPVVYNSFADVNPTYTNDTLFATVYNAMAANSILRSQVSANATDYPADGLLEVIKQDASHGACTLSAADGVYNLSITPENIEQIFGGGALDKWIKTALEADLTVLESEMNVLTGSVNATPAALRSVIKDTVNTTVDTDSFTPINEQIAYQTNILEKVFEKELLAIMGFGDGSDGEILTSKTITVTDQQLPAKIQATNINLASGQTITVSKACAGLYIYSQGDIIINGSIVMTDLGYDSSVVSDTITVKGTEYKLAKGGKSGKSGLGGRGGEAHARSKGLPILYQYPKEIEAAASGCVGTLIAPGKDGTHCGGGQGQAAAGGSGGYAAIDADQKVETNGTNGGATIRNYAKIPGAVILIALGKIVINGSIISKGVQGTAGQRGDTGTGIYQRQTDSSNFISVSARGGSGGYSGYSGSGGGCVTLIGKNITISGSIMLNGGLQSENMGQGDTGSNGGSSNSSTPVPSGYGGTGGFGSYAGLPGEIKQYLI